MNHKWLSELPKNCEVCHKPFGEHFIDGKHKYGPWALMCEKCHNEFGVGFGIGKGQKYVTQTREGVEGFK